MAEVFILQCQGHYDYQFEPDPILDTGRSRGQILLGNNIIWESERGYYSDEVANEVAVEHLRTKLEELFKSG